MHSKTILWPTLSIIRKTLDFTGLQKIMVNTHQKEGKPQKVLAKEAGQSGNVLSNHIHRKLNGRKKRL